MYDGTLEEWEARRQSLAKLRHKWKLFIPGNHDWYVHNWPHHIYNELLEVGVILLDRESIDIEGVHILGLPFVTNLPSWAYNRTEADIEAFLERLAAPDIMVTHAPPHGVLDAIPPHSKYGNGQYPIHVGSKAYSEWLLNLKDKKPSHWFCGHIHEGYGRQLVNNVEVINVAMCDGDYKQVNPAMVVDL